MSKHRQRLAIPDTLKLAVAHHKSGQLQEAEALYQQTLRKEPNQPSALHMLGVLAHQRGNHEVAVRFANKALGVLPTYAQAFNTMGLALRELGDLNGAAINFQKALTLKSDYAEARCNIGMIQLLTGDFTQGWNNYAWRKKIQGNSVLQANYKQPAWDGVELKNKTIFLYCEQGLGDAIQFVRYVPLLNLMGAKVILESPKQLFQLFKEIDFSGKLICLGDTPPRFDYYASIVDLPQLLRRSFRDLPVWKPYLQAKQDIKKKWEQLLKFGSELKVGFVWAGNPQHPYDGKRTIDAHLFMPLLQIPDISLYSLQVGRNDESKTTFGNQITHVGHLISDFSDTAAVISKLNLIITVDTAVAHLSGALGCATMTLLPAVPDWRWLLGRDDTPWYPTMKLIRQPKPNDWRTVLNIVHEEVLRLKDQRNCI